MTHKAIDGGERFDVLVIKVLGSEVVAVTGSRLTDREAVQREATTIARTALGEYFVVRAPAGKYVKGATFEGEPS